MSHLFCLHAYCILLNHDCIHATISISFRMQRILLSPFRITIFSFYVGHQTGGKWPQPSFIQIVFVPLVQVDVTGSGDSNIDPQHLWTEILFLETIIMTLRCDSWRKSRIQLWILICDNLFDEAIQCFLQLFFFKLNRQFNEETESWSTKSTAYSFWKSSHAQTFHPAFLLLRGNGDQDGRTINNWVLGRMHV